MAPDETRPAFCAIGGTKIATLQQKLENQGSLLQKIGDAVESISKSTVSIDKMLAVHEEKIISQERAAEILRADTEYNRAELGRVTETNRVELKKTTETSRLELKEEIRDIYVRIDQSSDDIAAKIITSENRISTSINALGLSISDTKNTSLQQEEKLGLRVTKLEKWKLIMVGGGVVLGYLATSVLPSLISLITTKQP